MPGTPWPVLGSTAATVAVAAAAGLAAALATVRLAASDRSPRAVAGLIGVPVAVASLVLWAVVRHWAAYPFPDYGGVLPLAGWLAVAFAVAAAQAGAAAYAFARWRLSTAAVALFAAVTATWYLFLRVGGETDVLWVWAMLFGPALLVATVAVVAVEYGVRLYAGRRLGGTRGGSAREKQG